MDSDELAWLYAVNFQAHRCFGVPDNATSYMAFDPVEEKIDSRDLTPPPLLLPWSLNHVVLRFSDAKARKWTFGRDESCNVVLNSSGVSRNHCYISSEVDGFYLTDTSTYGTTVVFDEGDREVKNPQRSFIAPVAGMPLPWTTLELKVGTVSMFVVLPNHGLAYAGNLAQEREGTCPEFSTPPPLYQQEDMMVSRPEYSKESK